MQSLYDFFTVALPTFDDMKYLVASVLLFVACYAQSTAQTIHLLDSNHITSIRGLSVVPARISLPP